MAKKPPIENCLECEARLKAILETFPAFSGKNSWKLRDKIPTPCVLKKTKSAK